MQRILMLSLSICTLLFGCDITEISLSGSGDYLSSVTRCNITHAEMIIEQKNIKAQGLGFFKDDDIHFNIYFDNGINFNEPVSICIYPIIENKESFSGCNIQLYLKAENIN